MKKLKKINNLDIHNKNIQQNKLDVKHKNCLKKRLLTYFLIYGIIMLVITLSIQLPITMILRTHKHKENTIFKYIDIIPTISHWVSNNEITSNTSNE